MIALPLAIALIVVRLGIFVHLHVARREFSLLRNTVSDFGTGPTRREWTVMNAVTLVAYALVLSVCAAHGIRPGWALVFGGVGVAAAVAMQFFPTDLTGTKTTATGVVHWALAVAQFAGLFVAMTNVVVPAGSAAGLVEVLTWIVRVSFYAFLVTLVIPALRRRVMGLTERLFLIATPLWFLVVAIALLSVR